MHGLHRLGCQHAENADVAGVSRVISGCFGSPALTRPLTDPLPQATFAAVERQPRHNALAPSCLPTRAVRPTGQALAGAGCPCWRPSESARGRSSAAARRWPASSRNVTRGIGMDAPKPSRLVRLSGGHDRRRLRRGWRDPSSHACPWSFTGFADERACTTASGVALSARGLIRFSIRERPGTELDARLPCGEQDCPLFPAPVRPGPPSIGPHSEPSAASRR